MTSYKLIKTILFIILIPCCLMGQGVSLQLDTFKRSIPTSGFGGQTWRGPSWVDTVFNDSVSTMYPDILDYPPCADIWDWQNGWFYPQSVLDTCLLDTLASLVLSWGQLNADSIDIRPIRFQNALDHIGAEGLYCLNMISSSLAKQSSDLRAAKANGVNLERIRLGDEMAKNGNEPSISNFPTAGDYARACNSYIDSIRAIIPNAKIAVSAGNFGNNANPRSMYWNDSIYAIVNDADALRWSAFIYLTDTSFSTKQLLAYPFDQIPTYERVRGFQDTIPNLQDYEIWVGYSITDNTLDKRFLNRWSLVLMLSASHNNFLDNKLVEDICIFNVGGIFENWDALDTQNQFRKRATGVFATIWNKAKQNKMKVRKIKTPLALIDTVTYYNNNNIPRDTEYPKLFGWRLENDSSFEASVILTNISEDTLNVSVANCLVGDVFWEKWSSDSLFAIIDSVSHIQLLKDTGRTDIVLLPFSINVARGSYCEAINYSYQKYICDGGSLIVGSSVYTTAGNYIDTLSTILACDSIINTELLFHPALSVNIIQNNDTLQSSVTGSNSCSYLWSNGATSSNIIISSVGTYWLFVTDTNNCSSDTVYINVNTLISSVLTNLIGNLKIYPNPSSSKVNIEFQNNNNNIYIKVIDVNGDLIYEKEIAPSVNSNKITFDLSPYAKGIYVFKVSCGEITEEVKVVKD